MSLSNLKMEITEDGKTLILKFDLTGMPKLNSTEKGWILGSTGGLFQVYVPQEPGRSDLKIQAWLWQSLTNEERRAIADRDYARLQEIRPFVVQIPHQKEGKGSE